MTVELDGNSTVLEDDSSGGASMCIAECDERLYSYSSLSDLLAHSSQPRGMQTPT